MGEGILESLNIEDFVDELEFMFWEKGIENFRITELFPNNGVQTYNVSRLTMDIEDGMVYSGDANDVILNGIYVIMAFLKESLISIHKTIINGFMVGMLEFKEGDITIEVI